MATPMKHRATPMKQRATPMKQRATPMKQNAQKEESEEGITVAIRMRPLNHIEGDKQRVWKVLPQYSSVSQTTKNGKPLPEKVTGRTFFTFDKTFGEDASTADVYDNVAKKIVSSAVSGLNGTIFAYGQTSSGKTYTMQGAGSIEDGSADGGGVVHMAARDIFSMIEKSQDRIFLVRASFLEIYNEEVRDLLSNSNQTLPIREDPRRGVFVQSVEEMVTDFESLLRILFHGEKSRAFAATEMNARSSRSHTIFRVTIESRQKGGDDGDEMNDENRRRSGDGSVRVSTLNLVDLAGSESVRHTGATGDRQKEGGMINQSLLTLSRVIVALGSPNQAHINFRDSKLTRILQPSLSGNANMAVICCATPSELYLEETRSTLQFASRAKLVKTNAQVNEVLDDRSIIRKLQRELAEARRNGTVGGNVEHLRELETKATSADNAAVEAEAKLGRLKASILNVGHMFAMSAAGNPSMELEGGSPHENKLSGQTRRRRQSEGALALGHSTPIKDQTSQMVPSTFPRPSKKLKLQLRGPLSPASELDIIREALSSKNSLLSSLKDTVQEHSLLLQENKSVLEEVSAEKSDLTSERDNAREESEELNQTVASLRSELDAAISTHEETMATKDTAIGKALAQIENNLEERQGLKKKVSNLEVELDAIHTEAVSSQQRSQAEKDKLQGKIESLEANHAEAAQANDTLLNEKLSTGTQLVELQTRFEALQEERVRSAFELAQSNEEKEQLLQDRVNDRQRLQEMGGKMEFITANIHEVEAERDSTLEEVEGLESSVQVAQQENLSLAEKVAALESEVLLKSSELHITTSSLRDAEARLTSKTLHSDLKTSVLSNIEGRLQQKDRDFAEMTNLYKTKLSELDSSSEGLNQEIRNIAAEKEKAEHLLSRTNRGLEKKGEEIAAIRIECEGLRGSLANFAKRSAMLSGEVASLKDEHDTLRDEKHDLAMQLEDTISGKDREISELASQVESATAAAAASTTELESMLFDRSNELCDAATKLEVTQSALEETQRRGKELEIALAEEELKTELMSGDLQALEIENAEAKEFVAQLQMGNADFESQLKEIEERLASLQSMNNEMTTTISELESNNLEIGNQWQETNQEVERLRSEKKGSDAVIADLQNQKTAHESQLQVTCEEIGKLRSEIHASSLMISELNVVQADIGNQLLAAQNELTILKAEKETSSQSIEHLEAERTNLESRLQNVTNEIGGLQSDREMSTNHIAELEATRAEQQVQIEKLVSENEGTLKVLDRLKSSQEQVSNLIAEKESLFARAQELLENNESVELRLKSSLEDTDMLRAEKKSVETRFEELMVSKHEIQNQLNECAGELSSLRTSTLTLENKCSELEGNKTEIESNLSKAEAGIEQLHAEKEDLSSETEKALTDMHAKLKEAHEELNTVCSENEQFIARVAGLENIKKDLVDQIKASSDNADKLRSDKEFLETQLEGLEVYKSELENQMHELQDVSNTTQSAKESAETSCFELDKAKTEIEAMLHEAEDRSQKLLAQNEVLASQSEEATQEIHHLLQKSEQEVTTLTSEKESLVLCITELEQKNASTEEAHINVTEQANTLASENTTLEAQLQDLEALNGEREGIQTVLEDELSALKLEKESLSAALSGLEETKGSIEDKFRGAEEDIARLQAEKEELEHSKSECETAMVDLQNSLDQAHSNISSISKERSIKEVDLQRCMESLRDSDAKIQFLDAEVKEKTAQLADIELRSKQEQTELELALGSRDSLTQSLRDRESERDEAMSALEQEYEKNKDLSRRFAKAEEEMSSLESKSLDSLQYLPKEAETELRAEIDQLNVVNAELKHLLALSNQNTEEAREAALAADDELKSKERELEDAVYRVSQAEEELRSAELSGTDDSNNDLEGLIKEKAAAEALLEQEIAGRKTTEDELKRQMGEEQRTLINEGEKRMEELRRHVEDLAKQLKQSEAEAYAARQEIEELQDQSKLAEDTSRKAELANAKLTATVERLESQVSGLMSELNNAKAESYALKETALELKEKAKRASGEKASASSEISTLRRKISSLENAASDLKHENEQLNHQLKRMSKQEVSKEEVDKRQASIDILTKEIESKDSLIKQLESGIPAFKQENERLVTQIRGIDTNQSGKENEGEASDKLQAAIDSLSKEIKSKDSRIKKLEAVRLTKDQVKDIKKMKEERLHFEKKYMAYKEKLNLALKEIKDLKTLTAHDASGSSLQSEMNELRFDKEALESKLRKYATHCQRLEDDKSGIIDALRSCNRDHGDVGDINQSIVSLCDKLASLEQECETLTQAGRASDYGSDIHRLRNENSVLVQKVTEYKEQLGAFKKEGAKLHQEFENAHSDAQDTDSEKERKLRFLEQENLQLMLDLKSTKKQLHTAREDLELFRINGGGEPTLDFGAVGLISSSSRSLMDKDEMSSDTDSASKKSLKRTHNLSEIPEDKENESSQVRRGTSSASVKKQRVLAAGSDKKKKRAVPGLGEANQESEEPPAECAQS